MKHVERLEDTLNGKWAGLYGEVVTNDCYRVRDLKFVPDLVFDIGANVGTFTRFARELWPESYIVAVEPDPTNCAHFRQFTPNRHKITLWEGAIGHGPVYHGLTAANGSGETYLTPMLGYPLEELREAERQGLIEKSLVPSYTFGSFKHYVSNNTKVVAKIDCEGGENSIFDCPFSMGLLQRMDYIAMEVHFYAQTKELLEPVRARIMRGIHTLEKTHDCVLDNVHLWALRRNI